DRFGPPPPETLWIYHLTRIRIFASQHHVTLLKFGGLSFVLEGQKGKETFSRTILLPKKFQRPQDLENYVISHIFT
ncbi:MAG TPA: hypothetical protein DCE71_01415, partial [Parachlamydiales bacterium]|nr:hypothetical protein [Parachlamydiales bacterium]